MIIIADGRIEIDTRINDTGIAQGLRSLQSRMESVGKKLKNTGKTLSTFLTAPIVALGAFTAKSAIDFESAFAGVRKTVNASEAEFTTFRNGILEMSKELPASAVEIAEVAEAAGQLGIKKSSLLSFTKTMVNLGVATNMTSDQAATDLARLANITQMPQSEFDRLGSTVVALGNNFATTESEIVAMSLRLAAQGKQVGMSEDQIMALGTAMSSVGINAEAGGTAMTTILKKINAAVGQGGKSLEGFAKIAGMSSKDFKASFEKDAAGAVYKLTDGLRKIGAEGGNMAQTLAGVGIKGIYTSDTLMRLAGASNVLNDALKVSKKGWEENTALTNEAEQRYKTTASQLKILENKIKVIAITVGDALLPAINNFIGSLDPILKKMELLGKAFKNLSPSTQSLIIGIGLIVAAIGPLLMATGLLISSIGAIAGAIGSISLPIVAVVAGIALLVGALVAAYANSETFRDKVNAAFSKIKEIALQVFQVVASFIGDKIDQIKQFWDEVGPQFLQAVSNVFTGIKAVIDFIMPAVLFVIKFIWDSIKGVIDGALNVIMGLVKIFTGLFTADWSMLWDGVMQLIGGAVQLILNIMNLSFFGGIKKILVDLGKTALTSVKSMADGVVGFFKGLYTGTVNLANSMATGVIKWFVEIFTKAKSNFDTLRTFGASIWNSIKEVVVNLAKGIFDGVKTHFSNLLTNAKNIFNNVLSAAKTIFGLVKSAITNPIETAKNLAKTAFENIKKFMTNPIESAKEIIRKAIEKIKGFFSSMKVKIPMPHFNVSVGHKKILGKEVPYPSFSVDWYRTGGLFPANSPRMIGIGDNPQYQEAALPLSPSVLGMIGSKIADTMNLNSGMGNGTVNVSLDGMTARINIGGYEAKGMIEFITKEQNSLKRQASRQIKGK